VKKRVEEIVMPPARKASPAVKKAPPPAKAAATRKTAPAAKTAAPKKAASVVRQTAPAVKAAGAASKVPAAAKPSAAPKRAAPAAKKPVAPARKGAPAKTAPQATVTLKHMAAALAESPDLSKKQTEAMLGDLVALSTRHLKNGDKIRLAGLGILQIRDRPARMGRNPATGEAVQVKASRKIAFRPAKELKEAV
jgi:DNA-binding protein HU-beta